MKTLLTLSLASLLAFPPLAATAQEAPEISPKTEKALESIAGWLVSSMLSKSVPKTETDSSRLPDLPDFSRGSPISPAGDAVEPGANITDEFMVFVYRREGDWGVRETLDAVAYEEFRREDVDKWIRIYTDFLHGLYTAHEADGITPAQAELMVAMDPLILGRLAQSEDYLNDLARQMAEWTFFYEQLELWSRFVEERIVFSPLNEDEKIPFNPLMIEEMLPLIYQKLEVRGEVAVQEQKEFFDQMVELINRSKMNQEEFDLWDREFAAKVVKFADRWSRHFDGSEVRIDNVLYLVRNISERPENPADDEVRDTLARNTILLDVPKEKIVTPFDLIREDGALVKPVE